MRLIWRMFSSLLPVNHYANNMNKLWSITANTLKILLRTRQTIFFTFLVPLLLMIVIGYVTRPSSNSLKIGVVYNSDNEAAAQFVGNLKQLESLTISTG